MVTAISGWHTALHTLHKSSQHETHWTAGPPENKKGFAGLWHFPSTTLLVFLCSYTESSTLAKWLRIWRSRVGPKINTNKTKFSVWRHGSVPSAGCGTKVNVTGTIITSLDPLSVKMQIPQHQHQIEVGSCRCPRCAAIWESDRHVYLEAFINSCLQSVIWQFCRSQFRWKISLVILRRPVDGLIKEQKWQWIGHIWRSGDNSLNICFGNNCRNSVRMHNVQTSLSGYLGCDNKVILLLLD